MKPTSVIFLVIALLLIVGGMITCSVAKDIALTDNYTLFHEGEDGGTYVRHDFDAADVSKIELLITDAEIRIYDGAEQAYIEFFNFRDGLYTLSTSGKVISMDEIPDLKSIFSMESGFSFSGMRYILRSGTADLGEKRVNIHIPTGAALKIISVEAENCTVRGDEIHTRFDMEIKATESAEIHSDNYRTACALNLSAPSLRVDMNGVNVNALNLDTKTADIRAEEIYWQTMSLKAEDGKSYFLYAGNLSAEDMEISGSGILRLAGEKLTLPLKAEVVEGTSPRVKASIGASTAEFATIHE